MVPGFSLRGTLIAALIIHMALAQEQVTTTVIDVLSDNVEFSYFLRLLQRNQLVPYLNQQSNITLVAPVNSAFAAAFCDSYNQGNEDDGLHASNPSEHTSCIEQIFNNFSLQQLNNYIITEPVNTTLLTGYHLFSTVANTEEPPEEDGSSVESPIMVHHDDKSLQTTINDILVVDPDLYAESQNSYVQGIETLLKDLKTVDDALTDVHQAITFNMIKTGRMTELKGKTIILPIDDSFSLFEEHQLEYLYTKYAELDSQLIIDSLVIDGVYGGAIPENTTVENLLGHEISLSSIEDGKFITLNNSFTSIDSAILAHGTVIHLFNSTELIPEIHFNVLKTLVGLKADSFVDELLFQDLSPLITNNSIEQTIFYPQDSSQFFSIASKASNLYHFVDEKITNLDDYKTLYDTYFCNTKKMGDSCQRVKVENYGDKTTVLNNNVMVEEGPFEVGNTLIYLTDEDLRTPGDLLSSVNSAVFQCSTSLQQLIDLQLTKLSSNHNGYTFLLPCFNSWDDYSLTLNYLQNNRTAMEILMKSFILEGLLYTDFIEDERSFTNLNDEKVLINYQSEDELDVNLKYNGINFTLGRDNDILFNQGVIHPIEEVFFPEDLNIRLLDIFEHSDADVFLDLLKIFPDLEEIISNNSYSILLPSSRSLSTLPIFNSNSSLREMLELHFIPEASLEDLFDCSDDPIMTLHSGVNLTCSDLSDNDGSVLQIHGGSSTTGVKVLRKGCLPGKKHTCIYLIDKPFSLDWLSSHQHYHVSLPAIAVIVGMITGAMLVVLLLVGFMMFIVRRKSGYTTTNGHLSDSGADENTPLITDETNNLDYHANDLSSNNFESQYSSNTNVDPISFGKRK